MVKCAVAAGHQKTLEAAKEVLAAGGNAVDAAIAAYWMAFIAEPCMASAGAGGFALVKMGHEFYNVDFFCQTPLIKKPLSVLDFYPVEVDFGDEKEIFQIGKGSAAVPGAIAGVFEMHKKWGRIPMQELASMAILAAKEGVALDRFQGEDFVLLKDIFKVAEEQRDTFFKGDQIKQEGDLIRMEQYADFLEALVHEGQALFYKGEIANKIANDFEQGGLLTRKDFENYQVLIQKPISFDFANSKVKTATLPSVGGMIIAVLLHKMEEALHEGTTFLSNEHFSILEKTCQETFELSKNDKALAYYLMHEIGINLSKEQARVSGKQTKGTSHFSIIDRDGNAVALTTSIGEGNGYFIPGTQMQMNNMLGEAALLPKGFHSWEENTRLRSMMSPTMVCNPNGYLSLVIGSGGAGRIPYAIAQTIMNKYLFKKDLESAILSPRVYFDGQKLQAEQGFDLASIQENWNIWSKQGLFFGGTNCVEITSKEVNAMGDPRRYASAWKE